MKLIESSEIYSIALKHFEQWKSIFKTEFPHASFEHIGSTAIKGALTKGDIDFYLEVEVSKHKQVVNRLLELGFSIKPDTHRDTNLCMVNNDDFAIQVVSKGSKYEFFKHFRDKINQDPNSLKQYNALKISAKNLSEEDYRKIKSTFIESLLKTS